MTTTEAAKSAEQKPTEKTLAAAEKTTTTNIIKVSLKPYTVTELATMYGVCNRTFKTWINKKAPHVGQRVGRYYNVRQVKLIFEEFALPTNITFEIEVKKGEMDMN